MERYFIFCGDAYYPAGYDDYVGWADSLIFAETTLEETMQKERHDWGFVMNMDGKMVLSCRYCPYDERIIWNIL